MNIENLHLVTMLTLACLLLTGANVNAHHIVLNDIELNAPVELAGYVVGIDWEAPHAVLHIEIHRANDTNQLWLVQMDSPEELSERAFTMRTVDNLDTVAVIMYLSISSACDDVCLGYGLSLTDPNLNTYTLSKEIAAALTEFKKEGQ